MNAIPSSCALALAPTERLYRGHGDRGCGRAGGRHGGRPCAHHPTPAPALGGAASARHRRAAAAGHQPEPVPAGFRVRAGGRPAAGDRGAGGGAPRRRARPGAARRHRLRENLHHGQRDRAGRAKWRETPARPRAAAPAGERESACATGIEDSPHILCFAAAVLQAVVWMSISGGSGGQNGTIRCATGFANSPRILRSNVPLPLYTGSSCNRIRVEAAGLHAAGHGRGERFYNLEFWGPIFGLGRLNEIFNPW